MSRSVFNHRRGVMSGTLLTADSFNRSNGAIGSTDGAGLLDSVAWVPQTGTWEVNTNQARVNDAFPGRRIVTIDHRTADVDITVTHVAADVNGQSIIFRFTDTSNYCLLLGDNTQLQLIKIVGGSSFAINAHNYGALNAGTVMRLLCYGTSLRVFVDGVDSGITASESFNQTATNHGMGAQGTGQRFDDWKAYAS